MVTEYTSMLLHVPDSGNQAASEGIQNVPPHSNVYLAAPPDFSQAGLWDMPQHSNMTCRGTRYGPTQCAVLSSTTCCNALWT